MKNNDIVFGTRPVLEAINSGKTLEKLFIQKNLKKEILEKINSKLSNKKINISYFPKEKLNLIKKKIIKVLFVIYLQYHTNQSKRLSRGFLKRGKIHSSSF